MSRDSFSYGHGDTGNKPGSALDFQSNDRPDSEHFDWWWYTVIESINGHASEFGRLDSDNDGIVDNSDKVGGNTYSDIQTWVSNNHASDAHDNAAHSKTFATTSELYTDSDAVAAADGEVSAAATTLSGLDSQVDTNTSDISSLQSNKLDSTSYTPETDTHDKYTDSEAVTAADGEVSTAASTLSGLDSQVDTNKTNLSGHISDGDHNQLSGNVVGRTAAITELSGNVYVQSTEPSSHTAGDIWIQT